MVWNSAVGEWMDEAAMEPSEEKEVVVEAPVVEKRHTRQDTERDPPPPPPPEVHPQERMRSHQILHDLITPSLLERVIVAVCKIIDELTSEEGRSTRLAAIIPRGNEARMGECTHTPTSPSP